MVLLKTLTPLNDNYALKRTFTTSKSLVPKVFFLGGGEICFAAQEGLTGARQSLLTPSGERENMFNLPCSNSNLLDVDASLCPTPVRKLAI